MNLAAKFGFSIVLERTPKHRTSNINTPNTSNMTQILRPNTKQADRTSNFKKSVFLAFFTAFSEKIVKN